MQRRHVAVSVGLLVMLLLTLPEQVKYLSLSVGLPTCSAIIRNCISGFMHWVIVSENSIIQALTLTALTTCKSLALTGFQPDCGDTDPL